MKKIFAVVFLSLMFLLRSAISVAVLDLKDKGPGESVASILTDILISHLSELNYFHILEREQLDNIIEEQGLQNSGLCDDNACLVKIGGIIGANKMITGSIGNIGTVYSVSLRMFDVETAKNDNSVTLNKKCAKEELIGLVKEAANDLTKGLSKKMPSHPSAELKADYDKKLQKLQEYERAVEAAENKATQGKITRTCENIAMTVASVLAAFYVDSGCNDKIVEEKILSRKSDYGKSVVFPRSDLKIPNDFKVDINQSNVIVSHRNGTNHSVRWK
ncbi:MAG: hypothetical protein JXN63_02530 [Candidatus Delongbacteria bacterium]|nr:hypothetical protein [Candidatus Delongbacteria bacterium]